jgi:hypothetical protein
MNRKASKFLKKIIKKKKKMKNSLETKLIRQTADKKHFITMPQTK